MNRTWGQDLRPLNTEGFRRKLEAGLKNKNPRSPLANCLSRKRTIRWGNKADPFQRAERQWRIAPEVFRTLIDLKWSFVIQTQHTDVMMDYRREIVQAGKLGLITVMPAISPGWDRDWEILERRRTNRPDQRLAHLKWLAKKGVPIGVNGEPFIPGFHTVHEFEEALKRLKSAGIPSYNTYNLHLNEFVAKRLHGIGLDIERIWWMNQDAQWKPILQQLLDLSKKYGIRLGCPDFVNTGPHWREEANTCCGVNVPNPCTGNTHVWKKLSQIGLLDQESFEGNWDGSGNLEMARKIVSGADCDFYTLKDAGVGPLIEFD
jgi:hypothetical protein